MKITRINLENPKDIKQIVVTKYKAPTHTQSGRRYNSRKGETAVEYIHHQLQENEINALQGKPLTDVDMREYVLKTYKASYNLRMKLNNGKQTIGMYRTKYNKGALLSLKPKPFFISLPYHADGWPCINGLHPKPLDFNTIYKRCIDLQIADPRFVAPEYIREILSRKNSEDEEFIDWVVPNLKTIREVEEIIQKPIYQSVTLYEEDT